MVSTVAIFGHRCSAEFATPDDQGIFQQVTLLQILDQSGNRLIHVFGLVGVRLDVAVIIPRLAIAIINLNHPHAAFHQSPRRQAAVSKLACAVGLPDLLGFLTKIKNVLRFCLHPKRHFQRFDSCIQAVILTASLFEVDLIHLRQQIELLTLGRFRQVSIVDVFNHFLRINIFCVVDMGPLKDTRQETVAPKLGTHHGFTGT